MKQTENPQATTELDDSGIVPVKSAAPTLQEAQTLAESDPEHAFRICMQILDSDPASIEAFIFLETLLRTHQRFETLADIYLERAEQPEHAEQRDATLEKLANLYEHDLNDNDKSYEIRFWMWSTQIHNPTLTASLASYAVRSSKEEQLLSDALTEANNSSSKDLQAAIYLQCIDWAEGTLQRSQAALDIYPQLLSTRPGDTSVLLKRCNALRKHAKYPQLAESMRQLAEACSDPIERAAHYEMLAGIFNDHLDERSSALLYHARAIKLRITSALSNKDYTQACLLYGELEFLSETDLEKAKCQYEIASLYLKKLDDTDNALTHLDACIKLHPAHREALKDRYRIYEQRGTWDKTAQALEALIAARSQRPELSKKLLTLAQIYSERLDSHQQALDTYNRALKLAPACYPAAIAIAQSHLSNNHGQQAFSLLKKTEEHGACDPKLRSQFDQLLAQSANRVGQSDVALLALERVHKSTPQNTENLIALADAYFNLEKWTQTISSYQNLLEEHTLNSQQFDSAQYHLGTALINSKQYAQAEKHLERIESESLHYQPALNALLTVYSQQDEAINLADTLSRLAKVQSNEDAYESLLKLAEVWHKDLSTPQRAIDILGQAIKLCPDDRRAWHHLLQLYQETKQWLKVIDILERNKSHEDEINTEARAKYAYTTGLIFRDELKDSQSAIKSLNETLDIDYKHPKAFSALQDILKRKKEWNQLITNYKRMLERSQAAEDQTFQFAMWYNMGLIFKDRLLDLEQAEHAFLSAKELSPDDHSVTELLAQLYGSQLARLDDAAKYYQQLLQSDASNISWLRELFRAYQVLDEIDKAWCVARTLVFLQQANDEEHSFFSHYDTIRPRSPQQKIDQHTAQKLLFHPRNCKSMNRLTEALTAPTLRVLKASDASYSLKKDQHVDINTSDIALAAALRRCAATLDLAAPRLFIRPDLKGGLAHTRALPAAIVSGSSLLRGFTPNELICAGARHLYYYMPSSTLARVLTRTDEVNQLLSCIPALLDPNQAPTQANADLVDKLRKEISDVELHELGKQVESYTREGLKAQSEAWINCHAMSACRASFLLCDDLAACVRIIKAEAYLPGSTVSASDAICDLLAFSVSSEYFSLRQQCAMHVESL